MILRWIRLLCAVAFLIPPLPSADRAYDVQRYGAAGDGLSDDTRPIQKAINAARRAGGGTIYFPVSSRCYMVKGLTFYSGIVYAGENPDVCIKAIASNSALVSSPATSPLSNITIANLTFNGNATSFTGHDCLELRGPTNVIIDHVTTTRCGEDGVYVTGWGTGVNPAGSGTDVLITNLTASHNGRNGMSIIAGKNITVRDSIFENHIMSPPYAGVDIEPNAAGQSVENITFENCVFRNNKYNGFTVWEVHADRPHLNLRLINCTFQGNGRDGAYIAASHHVIGEIYVSGTMLENKSRDGYRGGLDIWHAKDVVVTNLSVTGASQALVLWGVDGAKVVNASLSGSDRDLNTNRSSDVHLYASASLEHQTRIGPARVQSGAAPRITTTGLPPGSVGVEYFASLVAAGDPAIKWVQVAESLPPGLVLSEEGTVVGTPTNRGTYVFTVQAGNSITYDERTYTVLVAEPARSRRRDLSRRAAVPAGAQPRGGTGAAAHR